MRLPAPWRRRSRARWASIEVLGAGIATPQPISAPGLEKLINAAAGFAKPVKFRFRLAEAEVRTARIDIGGKPTGTGFRQRAGGPACPLYRWGRGT